MHKKVLDKLAEIVSSVLLVTGLKAAPIVVKDVVFLKVPEPATPQFLVQRKQLVDKFTEDYIQLLKIHAGEENVVRWQDAGDFVGNALRSSDEKLQAMQAPATAS